MKQVEQSDEPRTSGLDPRSKRDRSLLAAPVVGLFLGVPVWWVLGLFQAAFFIAALMMGFYLLRRPRIAVPSGFGIWLLFLVWLIGGLFVLQVDAPRAVPGESVGRYLTFSYRFGWYIAATIACLFVLNTHRRISSDRICAAIAWFFVILVGLGLLGVATPHLSFPSALELILPNRVSRNEFVHSLIHPTVAQFHEIIGSAEARPSAPFAHTNSWGMAMAVTLPFFVMSWWRRQGVWKWATLGVLGVAIVPIIVSLNRGLWVAIAALALFIACRSAFTGQFRLLVALVVLVLSVGIALMASPLGGVVQARLDNPHSDEGRSNLSTQAVISTFEGSPLIGFGSTRDVDGNFDSIAGGASDICPKCSPPPLGTHGQAWLLVFASGFGGLVLFTAFLGGRFVRGLRSTTAAGAASLGTLLVLLVTMPFYNSIGVPLFVGFLAVGLLAREENASLPQAMSLARLIGPVRRGTGIVLVAALLGGLAGLVVHQVRGQPVRATQAVLVPTLDMVGVPGARPLTLDSEAEIVRSQAVLQTVARSTGNGNLADVSERMIVGAEPNTRVLTISYTDEDADVASAAVGAAVNSYLDERSGLHADANRTANDALETRYQLLVEASQSLEETLTQVGGTSSRSATATFESLRSEVNATRVEMQSLDNNPNVGSPVTAVAIHRSSDALLVRVGGGLTMGTVLGLSSARHLGDRLPRLSRSIRKDEFDGLPVVEAPASLTGADLETSHVHQRFRPLGAFLADPASPEAVAFANRVGPTRDEDRGNRVVLVAPGDRRILFVNELRVRCQRSGLRPVGLVVVADHHRQGAPSR